MRYNLMILVLFSILMHSCSSSKHYGNRNGRYTTERVKTGKYKSKPKAENESKEVQIVKASPNPRTEKTNNSNSKKNPTVAYTRNAIVETAEKYIGTKYTSAGKSPATGFDCSGFTNYVLNAVNIPTQGASHTLAGLGQPKKREDLEPGDLIFFGNDERVSHVGIVSSNSGNQLEMIHSSTTSGVRKDNITGSEYWNSRFLFGRDLIRFEN